MGAYRKFCIYTLQRWRKCYSQNTWFFMHTLLNAFKDEDFRYNNLNVYYKNGSYVIVEE